MPFTQSASGISEDTREDTHHRDENENAPGGEPSPASSPPPSTSSEPSAPPAMSFDLSLPTAARPVAEAPTGAPNGGTLNQQRAPAAKGHSGGLKGILVAIGLFLFKFKSLLVMLKFGKMFSTMATMLLSIGVYATVWGWKFATGFVLLTFVHEMGHVLVAWKKKLPVSAPMFIPFMGAFINLKKHPQDALTEAHIGYGGPALGAIGDTLAVGCYFLTGNPVFLAVASFSMMVNLFNLMPVSPLDGGRIVTAISPRLWLLGLIGMTVGFFYTHSPIMLLVIIFGGMRLWSQWKTLHTDEYFAVPARTRFTMALLYIGLVLYLGIGHYYTHYMVQDWLRMNPKSGTQLRV